MQIKTVSIIGLGALGAMFGGQMAQAAPPGSVRFIADAARIQRYKAQKFVINGSEARFHYIAPGSDTPPADLVIFMVKAGALPKAMQDARSQVGPHTVVLSALNGITSEEEIGKLYGPEKMLYCVVQGMDVVKTQNCVQFEHMGKFVMGERNNAKTPRLAAVASYFKSVGIACEIAPDILRHIWNKFMLNVGVNQTTAVYNTTYGGVCRPGKAHEAMLAAMREAMAVARKEGVALVQQDIAYWLEVLGRLAPQNVPSMKQDVDAKRKTEVELFAGTVIKLGEKHGVPTPVNRAFYSAITQMEQAYLAR